MLTKNPNTKIRLHKFSLILNPDTSQTNIRTHAWLGVVRSQNKHFYHLKCDIKMGGLGLYSQTIPRIIVALSDVILRKPSLALKKLLMLKIVKWNKEDF